MKIKTDKRYFCKILINAKLTSKDKPKKYLDYLVATKKDRYGYLYVLRIIYKKRSACYANLSKILDLTTFKLLHITSIKMTDRECIKLFELFDGLEDINAHEIVIAK